MTDIRCPVCEKFLTNYGGNSDFKLKCDNSSEHVALYGEHEYIVARYMFIKSINRAVCVRKFIKENKCEYEFYITGEYPCSYQRIILPFEFQNGKNILDKYIKLLPFA